MPNTQALQILYGTLPLAIMIGWAAFNNSTLLRDILTRLMAIEKTLTDVEKSVGRWRIDCSPRNASGIIYKP